MEEGARIIQIIDDLKRAHMDYRMQQMLNRWKEKIVLADMEGKEFDKKAFEIELREEMTVIKAILSKI